MPKTLLQIIQQVQTDYGLPQATSVIGNTDPTTQQLFNLLVSLTDELRRMKTWTVLRWEYIIEVATALSFTGNVGDLQPGNLFVIDNISPIVSGTGLAPWTWQCSVPGFPTPARVVQILSPTSIQLSMQSATTTVPQNNLAFTAAQDTYQMPPDFDFFINRTFWDRTNRWELLGPDSPQMDQWHQSGIVPTGPRRHFRKMSPYVNNGQFRLWPAPYEIAAPLQMVFEYKSNLCVATAGNFSVPTTGGYSNPSNMSRFWTTDTDQPLLDDDLLLKGLLWKFGRRKGFNYSDEKNDWLDYVDETYAKDGARPTLNIVKRVNPIFISPANVQDGFFPGPVGPNST